MCSREMKEKKKPKKKQIVILLMLMPFIIAVVALIIYLCDTDKTIRISQYRSECGCEHWSYKMSTEGIFTETRHSYGAFSNREYWSFESLSSGEVTLYWNFYDHEGGPILEKEFSVTYLVDEDGNISCIASENEPDKIEFLYNWYK